MNGAVSYPISNRSESYVSAVDPAFGSALPIYVNPAQMNASTAAQPSSSSSTTITIPIQKKRTNPPLKRKRTSDASDVARQGCTAQQAQPAVRKSRDGPKKKKANRACFHCQKAHLTCDDSRPCQRCVKRGIPNCTEGHRKKAKYLLDESELEQLNSHDTVIDSLPMSAPPPPPPIPEPFPTQPESMFVAPFDSGFSFGSEAATSEYHILSAILGTTVTPDSGTPPPSSQPLPFGTNSPWSSEVLSPSQIFASTSPRLGTNTGVYGSAFGDQSILGEQPLSPGVSSDFLGSAGYSPTLRSYQQQQRLHANQLTQFAFKHPQPLQAQPQFHSPLPSFGGQDPNNMLPAHVDSERSLISPPPSNPSPMSSTSGRNTTFLDASTRGPSSPAGGSHLQSMNKPVTLPFDYTEGYHFLMKHLPTRFEKNDILRIVRALAIFRPSLIALQMPLSVEDETFVEKCFQRSILELEKLISFSGTPTVVWRRTGEICLVAPEFCALTGWTAEELVGRKKTYIYELFENQSVVEYWENFASHAFENTTTAVNTHCVLLKPSGAPIPATFCFSIRRDLYDLPNIIIGQWLPLL